MDRKVLVDLLCNGMRYPKGTHHVWVTRYYEITVLPSRKVVVDEYECYGEGHGAAPKNGADKFHLGRTVIDQKEHYVVREAAGWGWRHLSEHQKAEY